jgi:GNAT superfamily N-acetyltransferase
MPPSAPLTTAHPTRPGVRISTDPGAVDLTAVHAFLTTAYWCEGISRELLARAVEGCLPFSLFDREAQIGFARVITDRATFAYLADVYVLEGYRGHGLGQWLVATIIAHPDLQGLRRFVLATRDARTLYARFGFGPLRAPDRHMEIVRHDPYKARPPA